MCLFNHHSTRHSGGVHYLVLRLLARSSQGWLVRQILLPYLLHHAYGAAGIFQFFYNVHFKHLDLSAKLEDSAPFLRVPILNLFVQHFSRGFALMSSVPGSLQPASCFHYLKTEKVFTGCFPSLRKDFWCSRISSFSVRRTG